MSPERKIIQLERDNLRLKQRILSLERKLDRMKAEYEKKLKAAKGSALPEKKRRELIARRDAALLANEQQP
jgi:hypothetical protein